MISSSLIITSLNEPTTIQEISPLWLSLMPITPLQVAQGSPILLFVNINLFILIASSDDCPFDVFTVSYKLFRNDN